MASGINLSNRVYKINDPNAPYIYNQDTEPTTNPAPKNGDLWITSGGQVSIFISGSTWAQITINIS